MSKLDYTENNPASQLTENWIEVAITPGQPPGREEAGLAGDVIHTRSHDNPADCGIYINNNKVVVVRNLKTDKLYLVNNYEKFRSYMRRKIFAWADVTKTCLEEYGNTYALIELSYADNSTWEKKQITEYTQAAIAAVGKQNVYDYAHVLEIKPISRKLHYHLALHINSKVFVPYPDKSGMWLHGSTHIFRGKSSPYYLCKYVSKKYQKEGDEFPKGSRKYTVWLNSRYYTSEQVMTVRRASYPAYVLEKIDELGIVNFSVTRQPGGGWLITSQDKLGSLGGAEIVVPSQYAVYIGNEIAIHFPDAKLTF